MSVEIGNKKKQLLNSQMNRLGFKGAFNNYFEDNNSFRKQQRIPQEQVITLQEFFDLNKSLVFTNDFFICSKVDRKNPMIIKLDSVVYKKFKQFLIDNGFTHQDWINLLPKTKRLQGGLTFDLSLLSKEQVLGCSIESATGINVSSHFYRRLFQVIKNTELERPYCNRLTVRELLQITDTQIDEVFGHKYSFGDHKGDTRRSFENTFGLIQKKLFGFGFTKEDGNFMKKVFEVKTVESLVELLIQTKGFNKEKAELAVKLGLEAGFIHL